MATTLGFEHHILDFRDTFREHVIANFVDEYSHGRTPNPCVLCNSHIKWGKLMQAAEEYGCDMIATGHYAQIAQYRGHTYLKNAVDTQKDQTYFLNQLSQAQLENVLFPLQDMQKPEIRKIAFQNFFSNSWNCTRFEDVVFTEEFFCITMNSWLNLTTEV